MNAPLFAFAQLELPFLLGPSDGRYIIRGPGGLPSHVLMLETLGAPERRGMIARRRRTTSAAPEPAPTPVSTTRATIATAEPFADVATAERWQADVDADIEADKAVDLLNVVLYAHRAAAADPFVREVSRTQAIVLRIGIGEGEQLIHGRWREAVEVAPRTTREGREAVLRPQERLAAILSGRDVALACEELTLRARLDLDMGRSREAALQLRIALETALAELAPWADKSGVGQRLGRLHDERETVAAAANAAIQGGLDDATTGEVDRVLKLVESALRARTNQEFM